LEGLRNISAHDIQLAGKHDNTLLKV
jgi:hypothetical protein